MKTACTIFFRDDLIDYGRLIGGVIGAARRPRPWVICLTGDDSSGKSLIALAIDYCLAPERYETARLKDISADRLLNPEKNEALKVGFRNVIHEMQPTRAAFDGRVESILSDVLYGQEHGIDTGRSRPQPDLQALVISNLHLSCQLPAAEDDSVQSAVIDLRIDISKGKGIFTRFLEAIHVDPRLEAALEPFARHHEPRIFPRHLLPGPE